MYMCMYVCMYVCVSVKKKKNYEWMRIGVGNNASVPILSCPGMGI